MGLSPWKLQPDDNSASLVDMTIASLIMPYSKSLPKIYLEIESREKLLMCNQGQMERV